VDGRRLRATCIRPSTDGGNLKGEPTTPSSFPSTDDEPAQIVAPEMAWQVCDSFGIDTAWLHMMLCAYASDRWRTDKADYGRAFVIDREQVIRALGIPAISRSEQDRRALEHITALRSINVPTHCAGTCAHKRRQSSLQLRAHATARTVEHHNARVWTDVLGLRRATDSQVSDMATGGPRRALG